MREVEQPDRNSTKHSRTVIVPAFRPEIRPVTPGFVLEKIVIYYSTKAMPESYLGAPETKRV